MIVALLALSCVTVDDQRPEPPVIPTGQVDTGWLPDSGGPSLPETISCTGDADCADWLGALPCLSAACVSGRCAAEPMAPGTPCTDGDFRTRGDTCRQGRCDPGPDVCACGAEADCAIFDDGVQCNGRLACDGCACVPVDTPPGSACDDGDPATTGDVCGDAGGCAGTVPCQCESAAECGDVACVETICTGCHCASFPATAGLVYASESFDGGLPAGWVATTDNPAVTWSAQAGALRAVGAGGTYDHGATKTTLTAPPVVLPPGAAVLRVRAGLLAAEDGCDDRLELLVDGAVVATLCGPTAAKLLTFPVTPDHAGVFSAVFVSDAGQNTAAGPIIDDVQWLRVAPSECAPPGEAALDAAPGSLQRAPDVAPAADGWRTAWEVEGLGIVSRLVVDDGGVLVPKAESVVGPAGRRPAVGLGGWVAWEVGDAGARRVAWTDGAGAPLEVDDTDDAHDVDVDGSTLVYLAEVGGRTARRADLGGAPEVIAGPDPSLLPPRVALDAKEGVHVLTAGAAGLVLDGAPLSDDVATSRPALAAGHGLVACAWPTAEGVTLKAAGGAPTTLVWASASEPDLVAVDGGWFVAWTALTGAGTDVRAAFLGPALDAPKALAEVATYTFDDQDGIRLAPAGAQALAVWRTPWFDGDASGVVVRILSEAP